MQNTSFGTYEVVNEDPLTVKYTVAEGVKWSDGTAVDAADLLLEWAALSRALDTPDFDPADFTDPDTGEFTDAFPTDVVYFDSGATPTAGLGLVTETPGDRRRRPLDHDEVRRAVRRLGALVPVAAARSRASARTPSASRTTPRPKQAVIDAIQNEDAAALAPISSFWNSGFNFTGSARRPGALPRRAART